jgi:hypothetical protein
VKRIYTFAVAAFALSLFAVPAMSFAAALTSQQASSLITVVQSSPATPTSAFVPLITAFSNITVTQATSLITVIQAAPGVPASAFVDLLTSFTVDTVATLSTTPVATSSAPLPAPAPHVSVIDSPYFSSTLGYDLSYNALSYPVESFGFAVVGVTGGKAFVHNARILSEYQWTKFAAKTAATLYMNVNAPYGSTVVANITIPKTCPPRAAGSSATSTEPTACEGYNYGYNAAKDSYAYATGAGVASSLWWLDIEEANSWSNDPSVNDATIQGAIDYLNSKNIRVGIYSVPRMWMDIAGASVPTQTLGGLPTPIPTWFPIGVTTIVGAINTCSTTSSFIFGSPVWVVQYEASSTAVDQNIAC